MARIIIENLFGKILEVEDTGKTLLQHFHDHQIDWMQACGGKGRCTTCKVKVIEGIENLSPLTDAETRYVKQHALNTDERLSCQAKISESVTVSVPDEYKLPHIHYSN
jgi:ferredoxin, 2Fe-2S